LPKKRLSAKKIEAARGRRENSDKHASVQAGSPVSNVPAKNDALASELDKLAANIPDDAKKRLEEIKGKLDEFKAKVLAKLKAT